MYAPGPGKTKFVRKRVKNKMTESATTSYLELYLLQMNLCPIWTITDYKTCVCHRSICRKNVVKYFYQIFEMAAMPLNDKF